jgi:hypothetical protein
LGWGKGKGRKGMLPEVEGVEIVCFFLNLSKVILSPKA